MVERPHWGLFEKALEKFMIFLEKAAEFGELSDWHIIFSMGTVIRLNPNLQTQFGGFDSEYIENFPVHRLADKNDLSDIIRQNKETFEQNMKFFTDNTTQNIISSAYHSLLAAGYPYPGTEMSDRVPVLLENVQNVQNDLLWSVLWPHNNEQITNLAVGDCAQNMIVTSGECRRLDFMFPKIAAIIKPDLTLILKYF